VNVDPIDMPTPGSNGEVPPTPDPGEPALPTWDGLSPPYATIVADPPWPYDDDRPKAHGRTDRQRRRVVDYSTMPLEQIAALPVSALATADANLFLWTTNRFVEAAYQTAREWGFVPTTLLVWCKQPRGLGLGNAQFAITTEFILHARQGRPIGSSRAGSTWWPWARTERSRKPPAALDVIEQVSPGPYVELFARQPRLGWDSWGWGYEEILTKPAAASPDSRPDPCSDCGRIHQPHDWTIDPDRSRRGCATVMPSGTAVKAAS
jgi:N6-adenosine-specific RNA methylase IME4